MKIPTPPKQPASVDPEPWDIYWEEVRLYEIHLKNIKHKPYRQEYYRKRTEARQMKKMHELMDKYPDEAKKHIYSE